MSFHARLISETAEARQQLEDIPIIRRALAGAIDRDDYTAFLREAFHHVRHTVPLLMACGARLPPRLEWLQRAVAEYIEEEIGHHEWILDDLVALGDDRAACATATPAHATEMMVAYAYDAIARGNPLAFFGMVLVLEGTSASLATAAADAIEGGLRLPPAAFRYLRSHGQLDQAHTGFFASLMDRLDDPADQAAVLHAALRFYRLYGDIFRGIDAHPLRRPEAA